MEDLHKIWKHRWVTPKANCQNSKIHGLGTFAIAPISKGETVAVIGGVIVPSSDIKEYRQKVGGSLGVNISKDFFICPTSRDELKETCVLNHSCEPNAGNSENQLIYVALRDIKVGEEIVIDYTLLKYDSEPFKCNCQSKNCKGIIKTAYKA